MDISWVEIKTFQLNCSRSNSRKYVFLFGWIRQAASFYRTKLHNTNFSKIITNHPSLCKFSLISKRHLWEQFLINLYKLTTFNQIATETCPSLVTLLWNLLHSIMITRSNIENLKFDFLQQCPWFIVLSDLF